MSVSTVPLSPSFFHAILRTLASYADGVRRRDIHEPIAALMRLTSAQKSERLPSGAHLRYVHRIGWGLNLLKNAGLAGSPQPGLWRLSLRGQEFLRLHPNELDEEATRGIVRDAKAAGREDEVADVEADHGSQVNQQTPEERIDAAVAELRSAVSRDLLERIAKAPPSFFEDLVLDALAKAY